MREHAGIIAQDGDTRKLYSVASMAGSLCDETKFYPEASITLRI
jgi:hypothetical protein